MPDGTRLFPDTPQRALRVLIGCETSGIARRAFAARGHDVWSCDLEPAEDGSKRTRASGDSGFWDWGADDVYTRARAALSTKGAADAQDGASSAPPEPPPGQ